MLEWAGLAKFCAEVGGIGQTVQEWVGLVKLCAGVDRIVHTMQKWVGLVRILHVQQCSECVVLNVRELLGKRWEIRLRK